MIIDECKGECKPNVGVYALTSCYGCQLMLATVEKILDIVDVVNFASFGMLSDACSTHVDVDIAFVEGSVSTEKDLDELMDIRKHSRILVALGSCATSGGVQSWAKDELDFKKVHSSVYGTTKMNYQSRHATPISDHVDVDFYLPGCPPEEEEIMYFLSCFLFGTFPEAKDYPVCAECRLAGYPCILIEKGEPCLGPITVAGCKARCIEFNVPCIGCRGSLPDNIVCYDSLALTFKEKGFKEDYIRQRMKIFGAHNPQIDEMLNKIFGGKRVVKNEK